MKQKADVDQAPEGRLEVGWMVEEHLRTGWWTEQLCTLAMAGRSLPRMRLAKKPAGSELMAPDGEECMEAGELGMWGQGGPCRGFTFLLRAAEAINIFSV